MKGVDGLLLAGGRSSRFGRDKRVALLSGEPLWAITLGKLRRVAGGRVMIAGGGGPALYRHGSRVEKVPDAVIGGGPLAALVAGLQRSSSGLVVLACDLPWISSSVLEGVARAGLACGLPVAPRGPRGWEPLAAWYPVSVLPLALSLLGGGCASPQRLLDKAGALALDWPARRQFRNVNRQGDLPAA
ncbi:MAG: molybdenum cofactor guanylyltransferase [bacterium]